MSKQTLKNVGMGALVVGAGLAVWEGAGKLFGFTRPSEIVMDWWGRLRNTIQSWVADHEHLCIARVIGRVTDVLDDAIVLGKRAINLVVNAIASSNVAHKVTAIAVPADELLAKFPKLAKSTEVVIEY